MRITLLALLPVLIVADQWGPWGDFGEVCLVGQPDVYDPSQQYGVPWYEIDLDKSPMERWRVVAETYPQKIQAVLDTITMLLGQGALDFLVNFSLKGIENLPEPYKSELYGFANVSGVPIGELATMQFFYEISKGCTSMVAQDPNGKIFHARNQDFGTFFWWNTSLHTWQQTIALKDVLINVNFTQGGKTVFKGVTFAGHLGILTGLKPHGFTISSNSRFGTYKQNLINYFIDGIVGSDFMLYMDRDVMMKCTDYDCAINYLSTESMFVGTYFIVGGRKPGEGAIITRSPNGTDHLEEIRSNDNGWYVLETNYDWNKGDIYLDDRRETGNDCMKQLGQKGVSHAGMYQVLSSKPNLNKATVYTSVMQVDDVVLESYIRDCPDPCWFV